MWQPKFWQTSEIMNASSWLMISLVCALIGVGCGRDKAPLSDDSDTASTTSVGATDSPRRSRDTVDSDPRTASSELEVRTERMIVFKDGHAMFHRKGRAITDDRGQVFTDEVPEDVVLGSLWATSKDGVVSIRAERVRRLDTITESQTAINTYELLRANEGRTVTLEMTPPNTTPVQGTILEVLDRPASVPTHPTAARDASALDQPVQLGREGGRWVHIRTAKGEEIIQVDQIRSIRSETLKTQGESTRRTVSHTKRLVFNVGEAHAGQEITLDLIYVRPGVRWVPSYRLEEIEEGRAAVLSLQGELYNDAEALEDTHIDLVVGVPNLRFKDIRSPLTLESTIRQTIQSSGMLRNDFDNNILSNANMVQVYDAQGSGGSMSGGGSMQLPSSLTATQQKDLTLYSAGRLTLGKGSRATLPLWRQQVAKRDIFSFDMHPIRGAVRPTQTGPSPMQLERNPVWRKFSLRHDGPLPWTTGAVLMLRDGMPLAQELLTYTPTGGEAVIPVTVAVNIRGRHSSEEVSRKAVNVLIGQDRQDTEIRMRDTLELTNYTDETATIRVRLNVGGRVDTVSDAGTIDLRDYDPRDFANRNVRQNNNHSQVTWTLTLAPKATQRVSAESTYVID